LMVMVPSPSLSNNENASLNSAICSSERLSMGVGVGVGVGVWGVSRSWLWGGFCGFQGEPAHCTAPYFHRTSTPLPPHFAAHLAAQAVQCSQASQEGSRPSTHTPHHTHTIRPPITHQQHISNMVLSFTLLQILGAVSFVGGIALVGVRVICAIN
jgi:hypothetical protein